MQPRTSLAKLPTTRKRIYLYMPYKKSDLTSNRHAKVQTWKYQTSWRRCMYTSRRTSPRSETLIMSSSFLKDCSRAMCFRSRKYSRTCVCPNSTYLTV